MEANKDHLVTDAKEKLDFMHCIYFVKYTLVLSKFHKITAMHAFYAFKYLQIITKISSNFICFHDIATL